MGKQNIGTTKDFDKAVKNQFADWTGYMSYDWANKNNPATIEGLKILEKIRFLDFQYFNFQRLPAEITQCPNLKHINLLGNRNIDWQNCFSIIQETNINSIFVSVNDLSEIENEFWHYITGIELTTEEELNEIPKNILQQKQLIYLKLSNDYGYEKALTLPDDFFELINLQFLNLSYCGIEEVPEGIGNLRKLRELDLSRNSLEKLPYTFGHLISLKKLNLSENYFVDFPDEVAKLTNLSELDLSWNELTEISPQIGFLSNLKILDLSENYYLEIIPAEIGKLTNLEVLKLADNELHSLPPEIGKLKKLRVLELSFNKITTLPAEIGNLTNLETLEFFFNNLISLPETIKFLQKLKKIYLWRNLSFNDLQKIKHWLPNCEIEY